VRENRIKTHTHTSIVRIVNCILKAINQYVYFRNKPIKDGQTQREEIYRGWLNTVNR